MCKKIEVFSAGCPLCSEAVETVKKNTPSSCELEVLNMRDPEVAKRAKELGVRSVPAIAINGKLAVCCAGRGIDEEALRSEGLSK